MKDFYYLLGVHQTATTDEIKKAYRKLSLKFHPDKNDGDLFFTERFKEIQEAYETLVEPATRSIYDIAKANSSSSGHHKNHENFTPEIEYFKSSKSSFEVDDEITFSWKTINADKVTLRPFGLLQPIGQKTYKIKDFRNSKLVFELLAENTKINRKVAMELILINKTYLDLYQFFKNKINEETNQDKSQNSNSSTNNKNGNAKTPNDKAAESESAVNPGLVILAVVSIVIMIIAVIYITF